ncbi:MAG: hypothetical protein ABIX37_10315 [Gammaproteobacteria bacterium]
MSTPKAAKGRLSALLVVALLGGIAGRSGTALAATPVSFDPARVGWSEIRMTASKLFLTAEARLTLRIVPGTAAMTDLLTVPATPFTPIMPDKDVLELVYDAHGAGLRSRLTLLMDPVTGAALQNTQHGQEGKLRYRIYRFGLEGAYQTTRSPANASEKALMPARWTDTSEGLRTYPVPPREQPVVETTGLLYAIAAAALDRPGDTVDILVFRRRDTQWVRVEVQPPRDINVRYDELWPKGTVQRSGTVRPLRLSLQGLPVAGGDPDEDLELLGLRGRLELLLDPATRAPLQLSGKVKVLGSVTLKLAAVRPR